ncbi:MAG: autotransporter outer membrane beta-barrel domain-containing protein, partial [Verrucomicrobiales bacterium]|nr:autotransporter outer membrane beta-barrel domain-containing protein [Verrucomicrobiales bacterium]
MKKGLISIVAIGLALWSSVMSSAWADTYYWQPSGSGLTNGARINWPDTDGYWYNYNGHSYYLSGIPGEQNNAYEDTAIISYDLWYPTITGTTSITISNLIVQGGTLVNVNFNSTGTTHFDITNWGSLTTSGTLSSITAEGYSYTSGGNYTAVGGHATITVSNANWHNLGQLELSGKNLRTGAVGNYTSFDTYGTLNISDSAVTNEQEVLIRKGGRIFLSNSSRLVINSALVMSGTDTAISPDYEHSAWSSGSLRLDGQSTLTTQSATISYSTQSATISYSDDYEYNLYVSGSSHWENKGDVYLGNMDNSGGGIYISSKVRGASAADGFVNLGLLHAGSGANSNAELGLYGGYAQIKGSGTNKWSSGNASMTWIGVANNSMMSVAGEIDAASGVGSVADIDVKDSSSFSSGNLRMASGVGARAFLGADRNSTVKTGDLSMSSGVNSSGTLVVSRTASLVTNSATFASAANSSVYVNVERNSKLTVNGDLSFASVGSGSLRVDDSELIVRGNMEVAKEAGSSGALNISDNARLTVSGTLSFGDGNYSDLELNNVAKLGALTSTKQMNVTVSGTTTISGKNDYVGSTTIAFRAVAVLNNADARFGHGDLTNLGNVYFGNGVTQSTLTIDGNYTGVSTNGALPGIHMTANMNGNSPIVDHINILGNASGATVLYINQTGKMGGPLGNDEIVSISGNSGAEFSLAGGSLYSGLYKYDLTTDGQNWYLSGVRDMAAANAILNTAGASAVTWFAQLSSLNKRMGEVRYQVEQTLLDYIRNGKQGGELGVDFWVKTYGQQSNIKLGINGLGNFTDYVYGIDLGADKTWLLNADNSITGGYFLGYGGNRRDFKRNGSGDSSNYYTGFYATWLNQSGWFADFVVKGQYAGNKFKATNSDDVNFRDKGDYNNWSAGVSLEAGRRFDFKGGWFVEPSLQAS